MAIINEMKFKVIKAASKRAEWDELMEMFNEEEVNSMREYMLISEYSFTDLSLTTKEGVIYNFIRHIVVELITKEDWVNARNIFDYLYEIF